MVGEMAERFGAVELIDTSKRKSGTIFVKFFDLRSALAMHNNPCAMGNYQWMIQFAGVSPITNRKHPPNSGTIVIFNWIPNISDEIIWTELSKCGDIREIRSSPHPSKREGGLSKFIEFWDLRASQAAMDQIRANGIFGQKVAADFSRPGGFWKHPPLENRAPTVVRVSRKDRPSPLLFSHYSSETENQANFPISRNQECSLQN
jgi:hypothetical protein